ncbi:hypothetical protein A2368_01405 [Candidatus Collierbacteria bacterium RIFOXYB1_FULL_49_13]|uniref:Uncharacterized protein n=1 Tax=Candidatus Collierbacteria bacterium RIFOXYB1_FULL_49_13 TaxID=1817728 RepID=A0A1F5FG41_9BACT|nr:MAG: hypothetical protein A2368_01405 [Candidatus Collierbacteria bacterium RIFOXYB1_FULL_49_13]
MNLDDSHNVVTKQPGEISRTLKTVDPAGWVYNPNDDTIVRAFHAIKDGQEPEYMDNSHVCRVDPARAGQQVIEIWLVGLRFLIYDLNGQEITSTVEYPLAYANWGKEFVLYDGIGTGELDDQEYWGT